MSARTELISLSAECAPPIPPAGPELTVVDRITTVERAFFGCSFRAFGANWGDVVRFQIVDVDGLLSPPGTVLGEYTDNAVPGNAVYAEPGQAFILDFRARDQSLVTPGLYFRMIYANAGPNQVRVICYLHTEQA